MTRRIDLAQIAPEGGRRGKERLSTLGLALFCGLAFGSAGAQGAPAADGVAAATLAVGLSEERVLPWPMEHVWPTAVRYLRVDRGYTIVDKDADSGFILFEFPAGSDRTGRGSLELFVSKDASGRPGVHVKIGTNTGPVHLPHAILEGLAAKLKTERGQPPAPPTTRPPSGPPAKKPGAKPGEKPPANPQPQPPPEDPDGDDLTLE